MKELNDAVGQGSGRDTDFRFDTYGRLMCMNAPDPSSDTESLVLSERVDEVFTGMTYMKENCSGGAC
jgi:hypothetical protein